MLSEKLVLKLGYNFWPESKKDFESELKKARDKGYTVPNINYKKGIYYQEQAKNSLKKLGVKEGCQFYNIISKYRSFPKGNGEELNSVNAIYQNANNDYWEDDYHNFCKVYLQLSSIEGEGSYFYSLNTGAVYDVSWNDMDYLVYGNLEPKWSTYLDFLNWYYFEEI